MPFTASLNLSKAEVAPRENDLDLTSISTGGLLTSLELISGPLFYSGKANSPQLSYTTFDTAHVRAQIKAFEGVQPASLTTAFFSDIHLVAGQQFTINYEYNYKYGNSSQNDFAFSLLGRTGDTTSAVFLATGTKALATDTMGPHGDLHYSDSFSYTVDETGDYNLLLGSADALDQKQPSTLTVHSITITTADQDYSVTPLGLRLKDGSQYLANGSVVGSNGAVNSIALAAGSQSLISYIVSHDAGGLVATGDGNIVATGGGNFTFSTASIVSHDAGGIVSHDAGGIVSHDAGGIYSADGAGLTGQAAAALLSQDGGSIVSHDAGGIVSHDAGGFTISSPRALTSVSLPGPDLSVSTIYTDKTFVRSGDTVNVAYQVLNAGDARADASKTRLYLSTDATVTTADTMIGMLPEPALNAGNAVSDNIDVTIPAGLANGTYYIAAIADSDGTVVETNEDNNISDTLPILVGTPPTPAGPPFTPVPLTGEFTIGSTTTNNRSVLPLSNGNFVDVYNNNNNGLTFQVLGPTGLAIATFVSPATFGQSIQATELSDGRIAAVYQDANDQIKGIIYNQDGSISVNTFTVKTQAGYKWIPDGIAALSDGRFVVIENTFAPGVANSSRTGLAQVINGDGTSSVATFAVAASNDVPFAGMAAAQLPDGRTLFTFTENHGHNDYGVFFDSTFTHSTQVTLATNAVDSGSLHSAPVVLDDGDFVDVYEAVIPGTNNQQDTYLGLRARIFHTDGTQVGMEIDLPGDPRLGQHASKVVALPTGGFVVVFQGTDGVSNDNISIQRYNDDGTANGNLVVIAPGTGAPSFTLVKDGHLVVTYAHPNGSGASEVGQIFNLGTSTTAGGSGGSSSSTNDLLPVLPTGGIVPGTLTATNVAAGTHDVTYTDAYGRIVVDTSDAAQRLIKEVVSTAAAGVLATITLTYNSDGTYQAHGEYVTNNGTFSVDVAYGIQGAVSEVVRDSGGNIKAAATITYGANGSVTRHTTVPGVAGSVDETIASGAVASIVHNASDIAPTNPVTSPAQGTGAVVSVTASNGPDVLTASSGDNTLVGMDGADTITTGAGNDLIYGNQQGDLIDAGAGTNTVFGGMGDDQISAGAGNDLIFGNEGADTINGGDGNNTIVGGQDSTDGADRITAGAGNDLIFGNGGADSITSTGGNDIVVGGFGNDSISLGAGNDIVYGNQDNDMINTGDGMNLIFGGMGDDMIVAGSGNDTLYGNEGNDTLMGGAGADRYVFNPADGNDLVQGFSSAEGDKLDLQGQTYVVTQDANGSAVLTLSGGGMITLSGVAANQVNAGFFA